MTPVNRMAPTSSSPDTRCRLCGGDTSLLFCQRVLARHDVRYFRCHHCDLIQSEKPWWLEEAYSSVFSFFDTGAIRRNELAARLTLAVAWACGITPASRCADYGGGYGVFVRMMRDRGLDFRLTDKYARNLFARGFEADPGRRCDLLTCFEVLEHFADVGAELDRIFAPGHDQVLVSTVLHQGHREGWWYYGPDTGQHVAFYSRRTMGFIGERYGYDVIVGGAYTLFVRNGRRLRRYRRQIVRRLIGAARGDRNPSWLPPLLLALPKFPSLTSHDSQRLIEQRRAA